jgi:hypothetical protein
MTQPFEERRSGPSGGLSGGRRGSAMYGFDEKRVHARMKARWPVTFMTEQGPVQGETINVSATGAYVKCRGEFQENKVYWMLIGFERQSAVINGRALWLQRGAGAEVGDVTGVGVRFEV